jgi:hypothetical protein
MAKIWKITLVALVVGVLSACAGRDFVRPADESYALGRSTTSEIRERFGKPYGEAAETRNGKTIKVLQYGFASTGGKAMRPGVTPARAQAFFFHEDVLAGYEFSSSWADDHTDFDASRVKEIVKGSSTREDVIRIMGRPGGRYIAPVPPDNAPEALAYIFGETRGSAFNLKVSRKRLVVSLNDQGLVTDIKYETFETK